MSQPTKTPEVADCKFKWGMKRGIGGKKKECQFYQSFIYDNIEYSLYDNVYLHKMDEPEPFIGKIVKIWEQPQEVKKVKVLWFFRPVEIRNFLEEGASLVNELFLACGDGKGLTDINPLEAVAGKCNVVCTSKDSRNPQPSPEELRASDFVFYRTFDVGTCTVSDKIEDKIALIDVKFLLNREVIQKADGDVMASSESVPETKKDIEVSMVKQEDESKAKSPSNLVDLEKSSFKKPKLEDKNSKPLKSPGPKATAVIKKGGKFQMPKP